MMPTSTHNVIAKPRAGRPAVKAESSPIKRLTLAGMTLDALRDRILRGHYPEGVPLRQDAIATELGVSRIPVREALRQLEAEGLVTFSPHRGAVVSTLSILEITELFELRAEIESDLLRRSIPHMTDDVHVDVDRILEEYEHALLHGDVAVWGKLNWDFHRCLYAPSAREFTLGIVAKLHQHSDRYLRMQLVLTHAETRARDEHRAIADAAREGDTKRSVKLMRDHILGAGRALVTFVEAQRNGRDTHGSGNGA
jgi:DNA-binding GntR family transcriptional regulator